MVQFPASMTGSSQMPLPPTLEHPKPFLSSVAEEKIGVVMRYHDE